MQQETPKEKLELLHRGEVRTMEKDVAFVREQQATSEQERLANLKVQEEKAKEHTQQQTVAQTIVPEGEEKAILDQVPLSGHTNKVLVRIVIVGLLFFVLANVIAGLYWLSKKDKEPQQTTPQVQTPPPTPPALVKPGIPASLLSQAQTTELALQNTQTIQPMFVTLFSDQNLPEGMHTIVFFLAPENRYVQGTELATLLGIPLPQELANITSRTSTILYKTIERTRPSLLIETTDPAQASLLMRSWETTMRQDTNTFFESIAAPDSAAASFFRTATHNNTLVRFLTLSRQDYGIVYALQGNILVVSSSLESMRTLLDSL